MRNIEKEYRLLRIMTFFRYFGDCFFYGFLYFFLESRGLTKSETGLVAAITPLVALACNPLWSHLSKNANDNRRIMMVITVLEGIAILAFTQVNVIEMIALLTILISFVGSPFYSLHDGFIGTFAKTYNKDYTKIRFLGTIAYFVATLSAAVILIFTNNNYELLLYIAGAIFILVSLFFIYIKPIDLSLTKQGKEVKRNYKAILKNKTFIIYLLVYLLVNTISFAADGFVGVFFTDKNTYNIDMLEYGFISALFLLLEFIVMKILSKKEKLNLNVLWVIISVLYPLRSLLFALDLPLPIAIVAGCLRGLAYGMLLTVNIRCVEKICGIENVTAAFLIMAIFTAITQALSVFVFGNLIDNMGYYFFFAVVGVAGVIGMTINLIYQVKHKFKYEVNEKEWLN